MILFVAERQKARTEANLGQVISVGWGRDYNVRQGTEQKNVVLHSSTVRRSLNFILLFNFLFLRMVVWVL